MSILAEITSVARPIVIVGLTGAHPYAQQSSLFHLYTATVMPALKKAFYLYNSVCYEQQEGLSPERNCK
jgi:hypothetical protein